MKNGIINILGSVFIGMVSYGVMIRCGAPSWAASGVSNITAMQSLFSVLIMDAIKGKK